VTPGVEPVTKEGRARLGGWSLLGDPVGMEVLCTSGFDFVGMDTQHGFFGFDRAVRMLQIANLCHAPAIARVPLELMSWIPKYLDAGADAVMVAMVQGAAEVKLAVDLSRYQPLGARSFGGGTRNGVGETDGRDPAGVVPSVYVMIETRAAVDNIEDICDVDGLTGVFVGPTDLGFALGRPYPLPPGDEQWLSAVHRVARVANQSGRRAGIFATDGDDARAWATAGFTDVILSSDIGLLRGAVRDHLQRARSEG
jgi:4-hydroxy-2-oxoheptanedioate aldolase